MATVQTSRAIAKARFRVFDFGALEDLEEERAARLVGILWVGLVSLYPVDQTFPPPGSHLELPPAPAPHLD